VSGVTSTIHIKLIFLKCIRGCTNPNAKKFINTLQIVQSTNVKVAKKIIMEIVQFVLIIYLIVLRFV